jgi:hypothetical protein
LATDDARRMRLAIISSAAVATVLSLPGLIIGPSFDAAVFAEVGSRVSNGVLPYAGVWDHKAPGLYLAGGLAQFVLPWLDPWLVMWTVTLAAVTAAGVLVAMILRRLGFVRGAVFGAMVAAGVPSAFVIGLGGGLTEPMTMLPLAGALLILVARADPGERSRSDVLLVGVLLGSALLFSLLAAPGALAISILALGKSRARNLMPCALLLVVGLVIPWVVVLGPIALLGGGASLVDALVTYGAAYRAINLGNLPAYPHAQASGVVLGLLVVAIPAVFGVVSSVRQPSPQPLLAVGVVVWVAATVGIAIYLGRFETHYAAPLGIPLAVMATIGLADILRQSRRSLVVRITSIPMLAAVALISLAVMFVASQALAGAVSAEAVRTELVAAYLREHSPAGSTLFVWGNAPQLYYLADRVPASRFIYLLPLTTPGYVTPRMVEAVRDELQASAPALIVDAGSLAPGEPGDPPLLVARPILSEDGRGYDILGPVREYIALHYHLSEIVDGWPVYEWRPSN